MIAPNPFAPLFKTPYPEMGAQTLMTPLTKRERAIVLKAAARVAEGLEWFNYTCVALEMAGASEDLIERYGVFYGRAPRTVWRFEDGVLLSYSERPRDIRVLMLLTFAEVG
jgi:hypothetical protein